jgi:hypothetical protein
MALRGLLFLAVATLAAVPPAPGYPCQEGAPPLTESRSGPPVEVGPRQPVAPPEPDFHHLPDREWVWGTGLALATTTGVLRVMSDQHYATDVIAGMATGALLGWLVPRLHKPDPVAVTPRVTVAPPAAATPGPTAVLRVPVRPGGGTSLEGGVARGGPYLAVAWRW